MVEKIEDKKENLIQLQRDIERIIVDLKIMDSRVSQIRVDVHKGLKNAQNGQVVVN